MDTPLNRLPKKALDVILYGSKGEPLSIHYTRPNGDSHTFSAPFEGVIPTTERRAAETQSDSTKAYYDGLMSQTPCPDCGGKRLRPEILAVTVGGKSIAEASDLSGARRAGVLFCADLRRKGRYDRRADPQGDHLAPALFDRRGAWVSDALPRGGHALRRRGAAHPAGDADRFEPRRRAVYSGRAPPSACTSATTRGSSKRSSTCATSATR